METTEDFDFRIKYNFLTLFHWTRKSSLKIVPLGFRSNSKTSHLYESFERVVLFKKFLWMRKRQFWQAPRNIFLPKVTLNHRPMSEKDEQSLNFPSKSFFLNLMFCSDGIQFWKNCRKLLAESLTKFLLKIRESKQKIDFSKESHQKRPSGHIDCSSELYQKSFNRMEKKKIVSKCGSPANCSPRCLRSRCDNSAQCFLLKVQTWWKREKFFNQTFLSSKCSTWEGES